jgi:tetraprenyl-beta-curcumene synthase
MVPQIRGHIALAGAFAEAAGIYWLEVFPLLTRELQRWRARAAEIPDPALRRLALANHRGERGNLEGAAAFAVLAPRAQRPRVVRATVAFQAVYDYSDTLAEQPSSDPLGNARRLHLALARALEPGPRRDAGGDGKSRDTCAAALAELPCWSAAAAPALSSAGRMIAYQSLNHAPPAAAGRGLARWAARLTPPGSGLLWWETAAAGASSLVVFALIAAAASPTLREADVRALHGAYLPWIGALHVLLDSLIDAPADLSAGEHSLVSHYRSPDESAVRMGAIADRALRATGALPEGGKHALLLAAMASFYLSSPRARTPGAAPASVAVLEAMGALGAPAMGVFAARRAAAAIDPRRRPHAQGRERVLPA